MKISAITTRIGVYETLCPQQILVYKGGQIKNVQLITGMRSADVTPTKLQCQNIPRALQVFYKKEYKEMCVCVCVGGGGSSRWGGVTMDVNQKLKLL